MKCPGYLTALLRGLRQRCPRCGIGKLFGPWQTLRDKCPECGLSFEPGQGDTWAFMYLSTAFITGLILVCMLFIVPAQQWIGRIVVGATAVAGIIGTLSIRKGLSVAVDYVLTRRPSESANE